ncbi:cupin domain-containing protein [Desulfonatronum thioautotrophicum]|uniref:cupin domain-containing protein n=1 Tax=Desulfonatronum thioautotrophicum TaxID=617001 RepID=UPI0005EBE77A|nr:cupin domain-containing protein [Desulfonatronum thioautotrophicum]
MAKTSPLVHKGSMDEYYFEERCFITEYWNSGEDEVVSVVRARVLPGVTTRLHRLVGIMERYIIMEGHGLVEIDGSPPQAMKPGDVVLIPPGVPQRITNPGITDLLFLAVCTPRFVPEAYEDLDEDVLPTLQP